MSSPPSRTDERSATDFGWRVHSLLDSWTGKVDSKASITLAIESAAFAFVVTQTKKGAEFADLDGSSKFLFFLGLSFLLMAIILALLVVMPQLNRSRSKRDWKSNTIYFGHLRHWDPDELAKALTHRQDELRQLARQMVAMSKIAWRKHAWLQASLALFAQSVAFLILVAAIS